MTATLDELSARQLEDNPHHAKRWWILVVLAIAQLMVVLDTTVVNIALPSAQRALGFSNGDRQWVVTAYALAFGSLLLLGGRLADLVGRKRMFLIGLAGFALSSAVGGAATSFTVLVSARAVQGAFGAVLAPAALSLLTVTFTQQHERARAFGIYGAIAGGGAAIGLLLGGILTEYLSWRWCMYVNVVFAVVAFAGGWVLLHHQRADDHKGLDIPGIVLVSSGLFAVVFGFSHANTAGWTNSETVGFIIAGAVLLIAFVFVQTRVSNPVLPLRVVLDRNRGGAYLTFFALGAGMFGMFLFLTYYLQLTLGYSAVTSGLAFLPLTGALMIAAQLGTNVLGSRVGPRYIIAPGMLIGAAGLVLLTRIGLHTSYVSGILPATLIFGFGVGLAFSSAINVATAGVDAEDAGVASAMVNTGQQVGGSIGTALLNTLAATAVTTYVSAHGAGQRVAMLANIHSYTVVFWISAGIIAAGAVVTAFILRSEVPVIDPDALPVA